MHPSHTAQISVAEIRTIAKGWRVHGKAARGAGESLIADIWESAADELDAAAQQARERFHTAKIAAEDTKRRTIQRVKDLAAARQLAAQAQKLKNESERLDAQADKYLESGYMLAASEQVNAATRAMQQAERAEHALQIVCEVCEIDPTEL
ncbi:hypothetical protein [Corynebacterium auriscanis]|uniref:hypothetical protein n=1 Tax=Corynebacterium auriscanis TaxID=99807 RepID=UPI0024ADFB90|nr:hypothetical protein [Corynebacterium auriscanis]